MLIDNNGNPEHSIFYCSSIIFEYIISSSNNVTLDEVYSYCQERKIAYSFMLYSLDWLYLIGSISKIDEQGGILT